MNTRYELFRDYFAHITLGFVPLILRPRRRVFRHRVQTKVPATHTVRTHCALNQKDEVNQEEYSISLINTRDTHE